MVCLLSSFSLLGVESLVLKSKSQGKEGTRTPKTSQRNERWEEKEMDVTEKPLA